MATTTAPPTHYVGHHIQNFSDAKTLQPHWGYVDRVLPCTNDAGSCEYLDVVYHSHDLGMWYCGIIWATIVGIVTVLGLCRVWKIQTMHFEEPQITTHEEDDVHQRPTIVQRVGSTLGALNGGYLLHQSNLRVFGRATRLQVLILAVLVGYLAIWTFVGITYKRWITPVKASPGVYNTRTSLGPWSDRVGVLAFALTPLSVMLSSRESILSLLTRVPYQNFNFLHRWLGYIIVVQSSMHTIGWCIVEAKLYQPQPTVGREWIAQLYMIWGVVAMVLVAFLFIFSLPPVIRLTGYEFFRKSHYLVAMLYIGACWGHWAKLNCFMVASLAVWILDRAVRLIRTALLHYNCTTGETTGFRAVSAMMTLFPNEQNGDVARLDFVHRSAPWKVGQHYYLCFPELSIWQSHPFTSASRPVAGVTEQSHSYIIRARKGVTKKLAALAARKIEEDKLATTSVILAGPYGEDTIAGITSQTNVLGIAGGTGITYVLPVLLHVVGGHSVPDRRFELIWAVRRRADIRWVEEELKTLQQTAVERKIDLSIRIFVTRESVEGLTTDRSYEVVPLSDEVARSSAPPPESKEHPFNAHKQPSISVEKTSSDSMTAASTISNCSKHPDLATLVAEFHESTIRGPTKVYASGPAGMIADIRAAVAGRNSASQVWKGDETGVVDLVCDNRLEW